MRRHRIIFVLVLGALLAPLILVSPKAHAQRLHTAPIVIKGGQIVQASRYPIASYRLFRSTASGAAESIPFQIDEINDDGDYVLDQGQGTTALTGNGIFDMQDELSFMGDDVGSAQEPTSWPMGKPNVIYEVKLTHPVANPMGPNMGAVYVGIYFSRPPRLSDRKYVVFNRETALVHTSRYKYQFDNKNWLVAKSVEVAKEGSDPLVYEPILDSSTFYMKGDLKYFITVEANHRSIDSELEAWKSGPIRSLIRVSFFYKLLKLKIELGMYTEISFFSNALYLPAIIYNPIDGRKSLNSGSVMYYGLAMNDNPNDYSIDTNMGEFTKDGSNQLLATGKSIFQKFVGSPQEELASKGLYWLSAQGKGKSLYMEITPSADLQKDGVAPMFYRENVSSADMKKDRNNNDPLPLGKSPVNLGVAFDVTKFNEGEHTMGFRLFFENVVAPERLAVFKGLKEWRYSTRRVVAATPTTTPSAPSSPSAPGDEKTAPPAPLPASNPTQRGSTP